MGVEIVRLAVICRIVLSCPARGMGVEIVLQPFQGVQSAVMPREGHGSRNPEGGHSSGAVDVMPREGHGSRNHSRRLCGFQNSRHAPRGAWE